MGKPHTVPCKATGKCGFDPEVWPCNQGLFSAVLGLIGGCIDKLVEIRAEEERRHFRRRRGQTTLVFFFLAFFFGKTFEEGEGRVFGELRSEAQQGRDPATDLRRVT
ncbi:hypothetical protein U1Q18_006159 [Sarracenia purpurea var. burkii]